MQGHRLVGSWVYHNITVIVCLISSLAHQCGRRTARPSLMKHSRLEIHHGARQIVVWSLCWYHRAGWCHWCKFFQGILKLIHSSPSKHNFIRHPRQQTMLKSWSCHDQRVPTTDPPSAEASAAPVSLSQKPGGGLHSKRECLCFQPFSGHWPCVTQGRPGSWGFRSGVWAAHTV